MKHKNLKRKKDLANLPENCFLLVRVQAGGDLILRFVFFRLGPPGVSKQMKYRMAESGRGGGGVPAPFFFGDLPKVNGE